jgi:hypothetical protein
MSRCQAKTTAYKVGTAQHYPLIGERQQVGAMVRPSIFGNGGRLSNKYKP